MASRHYTVLSAANMILYDHLKTQLLTQHGRQPRGFPPSQSLCPASHGEVCVLLRGKPKPTLIQEPPSPGQQPPLSFPVTGQDLTVLKCSFSCFELLILHLGLK